MIPAKYAPLLFIVILSGVMSLLITGITRLTASGQVDAAFLSDWMSAWLPAWAVACPVAMVVAPLARRVVEAMVRGES